MGKLIDPLMVKNKYNANEGAYDPAIEASQANNLTLQQALLGQMNGGGPNLGQQQFQNATQQLQRQAASQIAGIKGISPAAQARLIQQQQAGVAQNLAGESAAQRIQQQLAAQQLLGQQSLGMFDIGSGRKLGAQQINSGVAAANASAANDVMGGVLSGAAGAGEKAATGKYAGGPVESPNGPQSEIGRALMGMASGGAVVPGQPVVSGDSPANDTVPIMASPGEVVLPRTVALGPNAPAKAASFVEALQRRQGGGDGYQRLVAARMACGGRVR